MVAAAILKAFRIVSAMQVMQIGIDIRTLMDTKYSGVPEYTLNLLEEIFKLDKKNSYKLFYNSGRDVSDRMPKFVGDNVKIISTRYPNKLFNNVMQKILSTPKINQFLGVDLFFMPNIGFISLSSQCRKIITIHDLSFCRYPEFYSLKRRLWHRIINIKKLLENFDTIVAVSKNTKRDIIELCNVPEEKIKIIYPGVSRQCRQIENDNTQNIHFASVRKKYNLPEKFILYLGTLEPRKNVEGIINAYNKLRSREPKLKNYQLIIAGGQGWKSRNIFKVHQKSKYKNDIKFLGYVDHGDKAELYNLADVFVYPSFYEGFGFPLLEAMACGCPIVTSSVSSLPEVVDNAAIMINPYNVSEIAEAITIILKNNELKQGLVEKGLKIVKKFTWEKTANGYLQLFA